MLSDSPTEGAATTPVSHFDNSTPVSIDLKFTKGGFGEVKISTTENLELYSIQVSKLKSKSFLLSISPIQREPVEMKAESGTSGCFSNSADSHIEFCLKDRKFILQISKKNNLPFFILTGNQFAAEAPFPLESPVKFTFSEAIRRALQKNFESRGQFERTMQARLTARVGFLNLLPHLNLPNLLTNFPLNAYSSLATVGDLVPFLLPSRWFMAKEAGLLFQAEKYAQIIMQADLATQVEGLGYSLQRDLELLKFTEKQLLRIRDARDRVLAVELAGKITIGSADHLNAYENRLEQERLALGLIIHIDKRAISQALGYQNPEAVSELVFDQDALVIDQIQKLDSEKLGSIALHRSLELQQIDSMITYSEYRKKELYFSWLDPTTDPTIELGIALGASIGVGKSKIEELKIKRKQLQSIVLYKIDHSVEEYNNAIDAYQIATAGLEIQERRLSEILGEIAPGTTLNTMDIKHIFEDYDTNWASAMSLLCDYRIARSNIDRMLLQGYYTELFNHEVREVSSLRESAGDALTQ